MSGRAVRASCLPSGAGSCLAPPVVLPAPRRRKTIYMTEPGTHACPQGHLDRLRASGPANRAPIRVISPSGSVVLSLVGLLRGGRGLLIRWLWAENVRVGLTSRSDHGTIIMQVATAWGSFNPELNTVKTGEALEQGRTVLKNQPVPVPPAVATCGGYCFFLPLCGRETARRAVHTNNRSATLPGSVGSSKALVWPA